MGENGRITVFLLDDHEVVRRGVEALLSGEPDIEVVGEAGTAAGALAAIPRLCPDVAVLDVRLPDGSGIDVCREVRARCPGTGCLVLTSYSEDEALVEAVRAGAAGYALKSIPGGELLHLVRDVAAGRAPLDPRTTAHAVSRLCGDGGNGDGGDGDGGDGPGPAGEPPPGEERLAALTAQERRVLDLIGEGLTNRQIGERLHLAEKTVKNYVSGLLAKLHMERRTQAAAFVAGLGRAPDRGADGGA